MITMDTEADESTLSACALSTCHCQAVLANERSAFGVRRCGVAAFGVPRSAFSGRNHIEVESVPMSLFNPFIVIGL
jgi:hypothetical protein